MKFMMGVLVVGTSLLTLVSCGANKNSSSPAVTQLSKGPVTAPAPMPQEREDEIKIEDDPGTYKLNLRPLNEALSGSPTGIVTVVISEESMRIEAEVAGVASGVRHFQAIHTGQICPDDEADANFDGIIDGPEGMASYGPLLLPLDGNLRTQVEGMSFGPIANEEGYYFYRKSVPFSTLMADLTNEDFDIEDHLVKLLPEQKLNLANKVMVVYGIPTETQLPVTVASFGEASVHEAIPVACGSFVRVE